MAISVLFQFLKRPIVAGVVVFTALLILTQLVAYQHYMLFKSAGTREVTNAAILAKERLQTALGSSLSATQTLSFVEKKYRIQGDFDAIAQQILESNKFIDALELSEGGVITKVYPLKGNETVVGFDILADSSSRPEAMKAIEKKQLFYAGPFKLRQGGIGIVGRLPIFANGKFTGFSTALIKLSTLINAAGIDSANCGLYAYQLSKINPHNGKEEFFLPHPELFNVETAVSVYVPNGEWKIYATPKYPQILVSLVPFSILGFLLALTGGIFAFFITSQPYELKKLVEEKSALLKSTEENYRITLERVSDAFISLDINWCYTYVNHKAGELFNLEPAKMIGKSIWTESEGEIGSPNYKAYHQAMAEQKYIYLEGFSDRYNLWFETHLYPSPDGLSLFVRDISERKKAELALTDSEQRYRQLINEIPEAVYTCNAEGYIVFYNKAATLLWGRVPEIGKEKWDGAAKLFTQTGEPLAHRNSPLAIALQRGKLTAGEEVIIERSDGSKRCVLSHPTLLFNAEREITGAVNILVDITERRKAEEEAESGKIYSDYIINSLPGVFYLYDRNGKFLRWNRNFEVVSGYSPDEISNMHPLDFFDTDEKELLKERIGIVFTTGMADVEANLLTKTGEKIPYFFNGYSGKFKNTECLIGMGIDISTRKKVENEVRIKEEKYRYLFNNNPAIILIWDIESLQLLEANDTALKEYGYTREEIPGMSMLDIRLEEDYERLRIFAKKMLAQTESMARGIWRHKRRNGELIYMDISSHRISYNSRPAILTLAENITQKLLTEERLKKSYDDIRLLNQHLETVREEERAGIAREIHDELGQQLTALKMDVYWLNNKVSNNTPQITERLFSMISLIDETVKTVRRIASDLRPGILDDLGLIAALEWQSAEFEKRTGIKTIFTTQISDVELEKKMATGIFRVYQEVLTNVARHANATLVETNVELADGVFCLSVQDNGVGFDPDDVKSKNTLGLIGMQERVAMLNGELILESKLNDGVKAMIKVPLQKNT